MRSFGAARSSSSPIFSVRRQTIPSLSFMRRRNSSRAAAPVWSRITIAAGLQQLLRLRIQRMGYENPGFRHIFPRRERACKLSQACREMVRGRCTRDARLTIVAVPIGRVTVPINSTILAELQSFLGRATSCRARKTWRCMNTMAPWIARDRNRGIPVHNRARFAHRKLA